MLDVLKWIIGGIEYITPDGWIAFVGSILGFLGVFITIRYTRKQFNEEKRLDVKTYLNFELKRLNKSNYSIGVISNKKDNSLPRKYIIGIDISNLGLGNCIELRLIELEYCEKKYNNMKYLGNLGKNDFKSFDITIKLYHKDIVDEVNRKYLGKIIDDSEEYQNRIEKEYVENIKLKFEYKDVLGNNYEKTVFLEVSIKFDIIVYIDTQKINEIQFADIFVRVRNDLVEESLKKS